MPSCHFFQICDPKLKENRSDGYRPTARRSDPYVDTDNKNTRVMDFLSLLEEICSQYVPDQSIALDESRILFKGRLSIKLFIRTKRARFVLKLFVLADKNGYMITSLLYVGSTTCLDSNEPNTEHITKNEKVVILLLAKANLLDKGYIVNVDNWFNSYRLVEYLLSRNTGVRGTVRPNRGIPDVLLRLHLQPVSSTSPQKDCIIATKFVDKKTVYFLSSCDGASLVSKPCITKGNVRGDIQKPVAIDRYNHEMGGVDVVDQVTEALNCVRKSRSWLKNWNELHNASPFQCLDYLSKRKR